MVSSNSFIGWIPNIIGYLSFGIIGAAEYPSPSVWGNKEFPDGRLIACFQKRFLSDTTVPFVSDYLPIAWRHLFDKYLLKKDATFWFTLTAESEERSNSSAIVGKIHVFRRHNWRSEILNDSQLLLVNNFDSPKARLYKLISAIRGDVNSNAPRHFFSAFLEEADKSASISARFRLERSGKVVVSEINSNSAGVNSSDLNMISVLAAQVYYFIKDVSHTHYHHSPRTDSILDVFSSDDPKWKEKIFNSLMRKVISLRRHHDTADLFNAIGVAAYAQTFSKDMLINSHATGVQFAHLERSITAVIEKKELRGKTPFNFSFDFLAGALSFLAIVIGLLSTLQIPGLKPLWEKRDVHFLFKAAADRLFDDPLDFVLVGFIGGTIFVNCHQILSGLFREKLPYRYFGDTSWRISMTAILLSLKRRFFSGLMPILLGGLFMALGWWLMLRLIG